MFWFEFNFGVCITNVLVMVLSNVLCLRHCMPNLIISLIKLMFESHMWNFIWVGQIVGLKKKIKIVGSQTMGYSCVIQTWVRQIIGLKEKTKIVNAQNMSYLGKWWWKAKSKTRRRILKFGSKSGVKKKNDLCLPKPKVIKMKSAEICETQLCTIWYLAH